MKLTREEQDDLLELCLSDGYPVLLKMLRAGKEPFERLVLECDLGTTTPEELVHRKLRAEGAAQLARSLLQVLENTKHPHSKAKKGPRVD